MLASITKNEAAVKFESFKAETIQEFKPENKYGGIRQEFEWIDSKAREELEHSGKTFSLYEYDLLFGINMYECLKEKYKISERQASQDGIWMFLSVEVIPDIVYLRWKGLNENRFYKESRRIWLKTLWWYIHLSWQGSSIATLEILKDNSTDDVVQLVERSGNKGYRVELYREIMKNYSRISENEKGRKNQLFRKVMKLNTARTRVVEPSLTSGGEKQYVKELFDYFDKHKTEGIRSN